MLINGLFIPIIIERQSIPEIAPGKPASSGSVYSVVIGNYTGYIQPRKGRESFREQKGGTQAGYVLYTDVVTPAVYGDKITQGGQSYIVTSPVQPDGISSMNHHKEIDMEIFE